MCTLEDVRPLCSKDNLACALQICSTAALDRAQDRGGRKKGALKKQMNKDYLSKRVYLQHCKFLNILLNCLVTLFFCWLYIFNA